MTLPTVFSWPLVIPAISAPGSIPSGSLLAPGAGISAANPAFMSEAEILEVLDRVLPEWYLQPLKDVGGYEVLQAWAKAMERASLAVGRTEASLFVIYSHGGAKATGSVEFYRSNTGSGAFLVKAGTVVRTSRTGRSYLLDADVVFGALDLTKQGLVTAAAPGAEYNVPGPFSAADGTVLPGEVDLIPIPVLDPLFAEPTIQVRQVSDFSGGQSSVLDQLGLDRELPRLSGEADESYKGRIRQLPDTVSPDALRRQFDAIFLVLGLTYDLVETWEARYNTCYDAPEVDLDCGSQGIAEADCLAFDDPRTDPFRGRWMDERDHVAGLVLVVPEVGAWSDRSFVMDDYPLFAESLAISTVVAPGGFSTVVSPRFTTFGTWSTRFRARVPNSAPPVVWYNEIDTPGGNDIEVRDGQIWNSGSASWVVTPGAVGILVTLDSANRPGSPRISDIEAEVGASSLLIEAIPSLSSVVAFKDTVNAGSPGGNGWGPLVLSGGANDPGVYTTRGRRATPAYDVDVDDPLGETGIFMPFYDGYDLLRELFYLRLWELLRQVKGGGTNVAIELKGQ